jgi:hypothetical protein
MRPSLRSAFDPAVDGGSGRQGGVPSAPTGMAARLLAAPLKTKELVVVEGWSHYDMYDRTRARGSGPGEAGSVLQRKFGLRTIDSYGCLSDDKSFRTSCRRTEFWQIGLVKALLRRDPHAHDAIEMCVARLQYFAHPNATIRLATRDSGRHHTLWCRLPGWSLWRGRWSGRTVLLRSSRVFCPEITVVLPGFASGKTGNPGYERFAIAGIPATQYLGAT